MRDFIPWAVAAVVALLVVFAGPLSPSSAQSRVLGGWEYAQLVLDQESPVLVLPDRLVRINPPLGRVPAATRDGGRAPTGYTTTVTTADNAHMAALNALSLEGWEVVDVATVNGQPVALLRRPR